MVLWIIIIIASILADQLTKLAAIACLEVGETIVAIPYLINFHHIKNTGAAWGMFSDSRWVFLLISFVAIIFFPMFLYKHRKAPFAFGFSLSLVIGGAIGNMIDRLFAPEGAVTDFIEFAFFDFPVFNVADICVCVGAALLFVYLAFFDKVVFPPDKKTKEAVTPAEAEPREEEEAND